MSLERFSHADPITPQLHNSFCGFHMPDEIGERDMRCNRCNGLLNVAVRNEPRYCDACAQSVLSETQAAIRKHLPALREMAQHVVSPVGCLCEKMVADFERVLEGKP